MKVYLSANALSTEEGIVELTWTTNELRASMNGPHARRLVLKKGAQRPKFSTKSHWMKSE